MKKLLLLSTLALTFQLLVAQDFKKVQTPFLLQRFEDAKTEIDKMMADPKNQAKAETYFWKGKVYASLYKDSALRVKYPNAVMEADQALKKYAEMDPGFVQVKEKGADPYFDMYATSFAQGVKVFNQKKWAESGDFFEVAISYIDEIVKNKWTNAGLGFDTTSLLYAGYSFQNANKPDLAAKYYGRLAENKIAGEGYIDVYKFLAMHYVNTNQEAAFQKYLALAKEVYPNEAWDEFEGDFMDKNYDLNKKTELYDKEDAAGNMTEMRYLQFGDLFVNVKTKEKGNLPDAKIATYTLKGAEAFKKAYAKNNQNAIAAFNVGVIYYNVFVEYDDKFAANIRTMQTMNSNKVVEKDPKKKVAAEAKFKAELDVFKNANLQLEKPLNESLDVSVEWLEKSYLILKDKPSRTNIEKSVINKSVDFLANLYGYKRDRARGKDAKAFEAYELKYKQFDALHAKF